MKIRGLILIAGAVAFPLIWFIPLAGRVGSAALSQYLGAFSLILMGITQLLATRVRFIEPIFGSIDRVYILHKWLAVAAVGAAYIHSELDADAGGIGGRLADTAEDIGEIALNGFLFLVAVSLITIIPYKYWKWSHRLIGFFFALAAFHYTFVEKPYTVLDPQGLYIFAFCLIGIGSYLYLLLPRMLGVNTKKYRVAKVKQHLNTTEILLKPEGGKIEHHAGQFTFINFSPLWLRETHPFTISSAPTESGELSFMIKSLGDYTKNLGNKLTEGTAAWVSQPFGHFTCQETKTPQVWIGAGIGITPFMAWAQSLSSGWGSPTQLYYCVPNRQQALQVAQFEEVAQKVNNFNFNLVVSKEDKRLTAERIAAELKGKLPTAHVYFCGPVPMRETIRAGLIARGLPRSHFHYEEFEIRDGIGVFKFIRRLFAQVSR